MNPVFIARLVTVIPMKYTSDPEIDEKVENNEPTEVPQDTIPTPTST